jgi:hypothetical protein
MRMSLLFETEKKEKYSKKTFLNGSAFIEMVKYFLKVFFS